MILFYDEHLLLYSQPFLPIAVSCVFKVIGEIRTDLAFDTCRLGDANDAVQWRAWHQEYGINGFSVNGRITAGPSYAVVNRTFLLRGLEETAALLAEANIACTILTGEPGLEVARFARDRGRPGRHGFRPIARQASLARSVPGCRPADGLSRSLPGGGIKRAQVEILRAGEEQQADWVESDAPSVAQPDPRRPFPRRVPGARLRADGLQGLHRPRPVHPDAGRLPLGSRRLQGVGLRRPRGSR